MKTLTLFLAVSSLTLASCTNYNTRAKNNAATGALIGGGAGALLGGDGNRVEGAAAGAAIGGGAGYLFGR